MGGEIGYGNGYGSSNDGGLPFFENYAGGLRSVRGYKSNTLGPRYSDNEPSGGAFKTVATTQMIVPVPFMERSEMCVWPRFLISVMCLPPHPILMPVNCTRSVGLTGLWLSPLGPIVLQPGCSAE